MYYDLEGLYKIFKSPEKLLHASYRYLHVGVKPDG